MSTRSLLAENVQFNQAVELIRLGARMAVLESETGLSHERLVRLYREVTGQSPSKGQLPYSTDWFIGWQPNIHSSLYLNIRDSLMRSIELDRVDLLVKSWRLYEAEVTAMGVDPMLSITRAWRLVKFLECDMLALTRCTVCGGRFVTHPHDWTHRDFVCGLCEPPARAGKSQRNRSIH